MAENAVNALLKQVHFLLRANQMATGLGRGFAVLLGVALLAVALDAVLALPAVARAVVSLAWVGLLLYGLIRWVWEPWRHEFNQNQVARRVEVRVGIADNALINAVDFSAMSDTAVSRQLVHQVIQRGNELSVRTAVTQITSFGSWFRWLLVGLLLLTFGLAMHLTVPALFSRVLPRYLQPFANHPAFTTLQFTIQVDPQPVYQGASATVAVAISGFWLPPQADLEFIAQDGQTSSVVPLTTLEKGRFEVRLSDCQATQWARVVTPTGQSDPFEIEVLQVPVIQQVTVDYHFPAYTQWSPRRKTLNPPLIRALQGTSVELTIESSLALRDGRLRLETGTGEQTVPLVPVPDQPQRVVGRFTLDRQTAFHLSVTSTLGAKTLQELSGPVDVVVDRAPSIEIVEPDRYVLAVEGWQVPLVIQAADDVALKSLQSFVAHNDQPATAHSFDLGREPKTAIEVQAEIDLAELAAKAGDRITYFAVADDDYPLADSQGPPHRVSTPTYTIEVITLEEFAEFQRRFQRAADIREEFEEVREDLQRLAEQRSEILEQLAQLEQAAQQVEDEAVDGQEQNDRDPTSQAKQRADLQQKLLDYNKQIQQTINDLWERAEEPSSYDVQDSLHEQYRELIEQLEDQRLAAEQLREALEQGPVEAAPEQQLQQSAQAFRQQEQPFDQASREQQQQTAEDLSRLAAADQLMQLLQDLQGITEAQRQIAEQLEQHRTTTPEQPGDAGNQTTLQQLSQQQEWLRDELADLMAEMQAAAVEHQTEFPEAMQELQTMLEQMESSGAPQDQAEAAEAGNRQQGQAAAEAARAAAEKLEALAPNIDARSLAEAMAGGNEGPGEGATQPGHAGPPGLPPGRMARTLQQLQQSLRPQRGLPPMSPPGGRNSSGRGGTMPGQPGAESDQPPGEGPGEGTAQGDADARGAARQRPPDSRMGLIGPLDSKTKRERERRRAQRAADGTGPGGSQSTDDFGFSPESLTPDARTDQRRSPIGLRGVPSHYREHGRAYLRRLNETPD
jgi:hypothetical protein